MSRKHNTEDISSYTTCKCPKCENLFEKIIFWTGNGMPRIFCDKCKRGLESKEKRLYNKMPRKKPIIKKKKGTPKKKNDSVFLGVDPGKTGSWAFLKSDMSVSFIDWPKSDNYQEFALKVEQFLKNRNVLFCVIEKVASMHGQGVKSVFSFGRNYGAMEMLLVAHKIKYEKLHPAKWQKGMITKTDGKEPKERVKNVCCRLFGYDQFHGPRDGYKDGRGDAALMAYKAKKIFCGEK